jgi:hypothetical protein
MVVPKKDESATFTISVCRQANVYAGESSPTLLCFVARLPCSGTPSHAIVTRVSRFHSAFRKVEDCL